MKINILITLILFFGLSNESKAVTYSAGNTISVPCSSGIGVKEYVVDTDTQAALGCCGSVTGCPPVQTWYNFVNPNFVPATVDCTNPPQTFSTNWNNENFYYAGCLSKYRAAVETVTATLKVVPCEAERAAKDIACGGAENVILWSDETCTGDCVFECKGPGEEDYDSALGRCAFAEKTLNFYDASICKGICGCDTATIAAEYVKCEPYKVVIFSDVLCESQCSDCNDQYSDAEVMCNGLYPNTWECDSNGEIINLDCQAEPADTTLLTLEPVVNPETAEEQTPAPDPADPDPATNPNLAEDLLKGIKSNTDKDLANQADQTKLLGVIAANVKISVNNQGVINENLKAGNKAIVEGLGDVVDAIGDIGEIEGPEPIVWSASGEVTAFDDTLADSMFATEVARFTTNLSTVSTDIQNAVGIDLPGSGSLPVWTVPTGLFGDQTIDLNNWSNIFDILASVFVLIGYIKAFFIIFG